ncbi:MAG: dienelactone hydrolase family protein [Prevotella sp.]|nr:dienelactone hydrolase family protein [Prevotella sp.]
MKHFYLLLLLLATSWHQLWAETINVNGTVRNYIVYVPANLGENRPLLISCHGMNQDAAYQKNMLQIESVADTAKFVTVFPNGIDKGWDISGDRDINYVRALIDAMVTKYKIDRNRVYLSGFSMGGMFTYHAMNRIPDIIAAFAPISGYSMGGTTANSNVRPIPIIHTHGTSDDVVTFSGVQGALNAWIQHNGCPTKDIVVKNYRGAAHITRHTWGPGNNGVEVVLMEMAGKGHWISNDNGVKTGDEIWKFCKRFSLELKDPTVRISAPQDGLRYITMGGPSEVPDIPLRATASDPDGQVVNVAFYDGNQLLASFDKAPYTSVVKGLTKGEHVLKAVVTDDEGRTGSSQVTVSVQEPTSNYLLHNTFTSEGCVPDGWSAYDGNERRTGFSSGYSSGPRVFHFTGSQHDFEWGLYTRNVTGDAHAGYARFADKATQTTLMLYPGNYQLMCRVTNWNIPDFSPVTVALETANGQQVWAETFTPTANIGNAAANDFSGTTLKNYTFDIMEKNRYVLTFYTADASWADLVVGQAALRRKGNVSAIVPVTISDADTRYYNLQGQPVLQPRKGIYLHGGRKVVMR